MKERKNIFTKICSQEVTGDGISLNAIAGMKSRSFSKNQTTSQMLPCDIYEVLRNTIFVED